MVSPKLTLTFTTGVLDPIVTFTRASSATYFDSSGVLTTAVTDAPRFDYNPTTLAIRGLLIEAQRTNGIRNNTAQGAVAGVPGTAPTNWTITNTGNGITREIVGTGTEDGISYIDVKFSGTAVGANNMSIVSETTTAIAAAQNETWVSSAYLRLVGGSFANVVVKQIFLNAFTAAGGFVSTVSSASTNWVDPTSAALRTQRLYRLGTFLNALTERVQGGIYFTYNAGAVLNFTLRVGLPQTERGSFMTSAIPTTSAAVTREADVAVITGSNFSDFWQSLKGGTQVQAIQSNVSGIYPLVQYDDGTANEVIALRGNSTNPELYIVDGGTPQAQIDAGTIAANTSYTLTGWWQTNDCKVRKDSGAVVTDTTATIPTVTQARLGSDGTNYLNGHLASIKYYDTFSGQIYTRRKNKVFASLL